MGCSSSEEDSSSEDGSSKGGAANEAVIGSVPATMVRAGSQLYCVGTKCLGLRVVSHGRSQKHSSRGVQFPTNKVKVGENDDRKAFLPGSGVRAAACRLPPDEQRPRAVSLRVK